MDKIPAIDLGAQYRSIQTEIDDAIGRVLNVGRFILGTEVEAFEAEFSSYCGVKNAIGVASGTDALTLSLLACDIGHGDEVIIPSHTAVAVIVAVEATGARPILVDINLQDYTIAPEAIVRAITPRTRAVVPVHLYGQPAEMYSILQIAHQYGLFVIEDCAQSHGAFYRGRRVGTWGDLAAFSFYPTKNLGAFGDGGMVVTGDEKLAQRVRLLRQYGWEERYVSFSRGVNSRLDELQAAVLRVKLRHLDDWNQQRIELARQYQERLAGLAFVSPSFLVDRQSVFHQYVIRHPYRDRLKEYLEKFGIQALIHYPVPIHLQPAYFDLGYGLGDFPNSEIAAREVLSLPIFPEMTEKMLFTVCSMVQDFLREMNLPR